MISVAIQENELYQPALRLFQKKGTNDRQKTAIVCVNVDLAEWHRDVHRPNLIGLRLVCGASLFGVLAREIVGKIDEI